MHVGTFDENVEEVAREALYNELRTRALARQDWERLLRVLRLGLTLATLVAAGLILDYDLDVLGRLGVSINVFPGWH